MIIATGIFFVLKIVFWLLKIIISILADFFIFFGLYVPGFYILFGALLSHFTEFSLTTPSTDLNLFLVGLGLAVLCAVMITVRNLIIRPFKIVFGKTKDKTKKNIKDHPRLKKNDQEDENEDRKKEDRRVKEERADEEDAVDEENEKERREVKKKKEKDDEDSQYPLIYRSELYPEITVHEYEDRFDLYRDTEGYGKKFFKTEYKEQTSSKTKKSRKKSK